MSRFARESLKAREILSCRSFWLVQCFEIYEYSSNFLVMLDILRISHICSG